MGAIKSDFCSKNHPMKGDNLQMRSNGQRQCRQCANDRARDRRRIASVKQGVEAKKGVEPRDFNYAPLED